MTAPQAASPPEAPRIGVALGSGGARGWAHIGVLRELLSRGIEPAIVCGTSMGAVVGAAYASGRLDAFEEWVRSLDRRRVLSLFDLSLNGGLIEARRVLDYLRDDLPDINIEELPIPYGAVTTDLHTGGEIWLRSGSLQGALRASAALPGLVSPWQVGDRWVTDGGLVNPVPVSLCRAMGADYVIAVDLNTTLVRDKKAPAPPDRSLSDSLREVSMRSRRALSLPGGASGPSVFEVISRSLAIMQLRITQSQMLGAPPDVHVTPQLAPFTFLDFDRGEEIIEEGRRACVRALTYAVRPPDTEAERD